VKGDPFITFIASRGFLVEGVYYYIEVADEVAKTMAVKRSIKAIPINIPCLFILTNS
jgi:hypothetical protein